MSSREAAVAVELGEELRQAQIALGGEQTLDQAGGRGPQHALALLHQVVAERGGQVALPRVRPTDGDDVDRLVEEGAAAQALELLLDNEREAGQLQGAEGLLAGQPGLLQQARGAPLVALVALATDQLIEEGLVGQPGLGGLEGEGGEGVGHRRQLEGLQHRQ